MLESSVTYERFPEGLECRSWHLWLDDWKCYTVSPTERVRRGLYSWLCTLPRCLFQEYRHLWHLKRKTTSEHKLGCNKKLSTYTFPCMSKPQYILLHVVTTSYWYTLVLFSCVSLTKTSFIFSSVLQHSKRRVNFILYWSSWEEETYLRGSPRRYFSVITANFRQFSWSDLLLNK